MATATYPPPPPYYKLYKDYLQNPKSAPEPPPPIEGTYILYGATYTVSFLSLSFPTHHHRHADYFWIKLCFVSSGGRVI